MTEQVGTQFDAVAVDEDERLIGAMSPAPNRFDPPRNPTLFTCLPGRKQGHQPGYAAHRKRLNAVHQVGVSCCANRLGDTTKMPADRKRRYKPNMLG